MKTRTNRLVLIFMLPNPSMFAKWAGNRTTHLHAFKLDGHLQAVKLKRRIKVYFQVIFSSIYAQFVPENQLPFLFKTHSKA